MAKPTARSSNFRWLRIFAYNVKGSKAAASLQVMGLKYRKARQLCHRPSTVSRLVKGPIICATNATGLLIVSWTVITSAEYVLGV